MLLFLPKTSSGLEKKASEMGHPHPNNDLHHFTFKTTLFFKLLILITKLKGLSRTDLLMSDTCGNILYMPDNDLVVSPKC